MNFTIADHNDKFQSKGFIHYDNVEFENIPEMVTAGYAYASARFKDNHRLDINYEGYEDVLILDIDEKVSIDQARIIFSKYTNFIITSKSHQIEKNNIVCDRYRVFIKLETTLNDSNTRDSFISNIFSTYSFVDLKCKNPSRFYYSSPSNAEVFYNIGKDMPIIQIPTGVEATKTEKTSPTINDNYFAFNELTELWENKYGEVLEIETNSIEGKLKGAITLLDNTFYDGNRNHSIFSVSCMLLKDGLSQDDVANFIIKENDRRGGMKLREVMQCLKSAVKTL